MNKNNKIVLNNNNNIISNNMNKITLVFKGKLCFIIDIICSFM